MRSFTTFFVLLAALTAAQAAAYPEKEIRLINPYPATGPVDIAGSVAANKVLRMVQSYSAPSLTDLLAWQIRAALSSGFDKPVSVERRARRRTIEGHQHVAQAIPDGYTLLLSGNSTMVIHPQLVRESPFNPMRDFAPVARVARMPIVLVASARFPPDSVQQFIERARSMPGRLHLGSSGDFSTAHLAGVLFNHLAGIEVEHVAFNGGAAAVNAVMAGQVETALVPLPAALPYVNSGGLRLLGIAERERFSTLPNLPTISEAGIPGFEVSAWYGLFAPAGTPRAVITQLNEHIAAELRSADTRKLLLGQGLQAAHLGAEEFSRLLRAERERWAPLIHSSPPTLILPRKGKET